MVDERSGWWFVPTANEQCGQEVISILRLADLGGGGDVAVWCNGGLALSTVLIEAVACM